MFKNTAHVKLADNQFLDSSKLNVVKDWLFLHDLVVKKLNYKLGPKTLKTKKTFLSACVLKKIAKIYQT